MESADARVALLSFYLSRNTGTKSGQQKPLAGKVPLRPALKRPRTDLFGAGGQTIYGLSEECPTLAALERIAVTEEQQRRQVTEVQWALANGLHTKEKRGEAEMGSEDMFAKYIDIDKCI